MLIRDISGKNIIKYYETIYFINISLVFFSHVG